MTVVDHAESIELLDSLLASADLQMDVLVDIDVGLQRTGVPPSRALALAGRVRTSKHLRLKGIQAYAGQVQHIQRYDERKKASIECMSRAVEMFRQLQAAEALCAIFSGAGPGTCEIDLLNRQRGEFGFLVGHMDRNNPHTRYLKDSKVFVIFHGPNAYISPNVYESSQLPTWNSISVHIKGTARTTESTKTVRDSLIKMASLLEKSENPYILDENNSKMQRSLGYVIGFEIEILEMIGRFKLSQNKNATHKQLAKEHLIASSKKGHAQLIDFVI
jgi:transcriptional regulator